MLFLPANTVACSAAMLGCLAATLGRERAFPAQRPQCYSAEYAHGAFRAVERARGSADFDFLAAQQLETSDLRRHLRRNRKGFLALYLEETRRNFVSSARVAREFAADTDAPELAFAVLRQSVRFHLLWAVLRISMALRLTGLAWRLTETLLHAARPSEPSHISDATAPAASPLS